MPRSVSASQITVGVLPVPPALRLPAQITGTPTAAPAPRASRRAVAAA